VEEESAAPPRGLARPVMTAFVATFDSFVPQYVPAGRRDRLRSGRYETGACRSAKSQAALDPRLACH